MCKQIGGRDFIENVIAFVGTRMDQVGSSSDNMG